MFAAIIARATRKSPREFADGVALLKALSPFKAGDETGVWQDQHALIAQVIHHNTGESLHEVAPQICHETGRVIAAWARLDNRAELCADLDLDARPTLSDPQIILAAHREWGSETTAKLEGDFSFVIYNPATRETYCGRDSVGARPFYYFASDECLVAATSIAALRIVKGLNLTLSLKWTALFAAGMNFAHDQGAFDQVRKLPPANDLTVSLEGDIEPREYFAFDLSAPHSVRREKRWVEQYRTAFDRAVADRARSQFLVGADNSGGLDSASIVATVSSLLPHAREDFHTFALVAMEREPELIDAVSDLCKVAHTHKVVRPEMMRIDASFERALVALGHPPEHGQSLICPEFFDICDEHGIRTIVSGYGGDEVATGYANHLIDELHHRREYRALFTEMHGPLTHRAGRFAKRIWRGPDGPDNRSRQLMAAKLGISCLREDFLYDTGLVEQIENWFIPRRANTSINAIAAYEPGFRYARAGRLESSAIIGAMYGVEYRYPLFDRRLIQQWFATPSIEKRRQNMGRYLHRRAMEGRIPEQIQWQESKDVGGFIDGTPNFSVSPELSFESLPSQLRHILDRPAFEATLRAHAERGGMFEEADLRRHYFLWLIRQLCRWLEADEA